MHSTAQTADLAAGVTTSGGATGPPAHSSVVKKAAVKPAMIAGEPAGTVAGPAARAGASIAADAAGALATVTTVQPNVKQAPESATADAARGSTTQQMPSEAASAEAAAAWYASGVQQAGIGGQLPMAVEDPDTTFVHAPWWPGQCIDCSIVGGKADPTGTFCGEYTSSIL